MLRVQDVVQELHQPSGGEEGGDLQRAAQAAVHILPRGDQARHGQEPFQHALPTVLLHGHKPQRPELHPRPPHRALQHVRHDARLPHGVRPPRRRPPPRRSLPVHRLQLVERLLPLPPQAGRAQARHDYEPPSGTVPPLPPGHAEVLQAHRQVPLHGSEPQAITLIIGRRAERRTVPLVAFLRPLRLVRSLGRRGRRRRRRLRPSSLLPRPRVFSPRHGLRASPPHTAEQPWSLRADTQSGSSHSPRGVPQPRQPAEELGGGRGRRQRRLLLDSATTNDVRRPPRGRRRRLRGGRRGRRRRGPRALLRSRGRCRTPPLRGRP
mmetsp:Transcript_16223/g.32373  ORF Transcript_16223/g.32373 Transcript_16223/m.32373 type:complete len:322 (+) Transcript_16223:796-1761(+)